MAGILSIAISAILSHSISEHSRKTFCYQKFCDTVREIEFYHLISVHMRVVLNLKRLLEQKLITAAEAGRLKSLSSSATFQFAVSILMIFGILALAGGILILLTSIEGFDNEALLLLGVVLIGLGTVLGRVKTEYSLTLVSSVTLVLGAILAAVGIGAEFENLQMAAILAALLFIVVAVIAGSGFLSALSALTLAAVFGGAVGYGFYGSGSYSLGLESRSLAIVVFIILGALAYQLSKRFKSGNERLAVIFARMSLVIVNIAFWIGSLFGDTVGVIDSDSHSSLLGYADLQEASNSFLPTWFGGAAIISSDFFAVAWAIAIVLTGVWAVRANSAFTLNTVATFAAIHFYSQWFERFGAEEAWPLLVAGGIAVLIGVGLSFINNEKGRKVEAMKTAVSAVAQVKKAKSKKPAAKKAAVKKKAKK